MSASASLLSDLVDQGYADGRVYDVHVPAGPATPYIWLGRSGEETWDLCDHDAGVFRTFIDIECYADDPATAFDLADEVTAYLRSKPAGPFGSGTVAGVDVVEVVDDFELRNPAADEGLAVARRVAVLISYAE